MKIYKEYLDSITVNSDIHERTMAYLRQQEPRENKMYFRLALTGLCSLLLLFVVCRPYFPLSPKPTNLNLTGLEVEDYKLSDLHSSTYQQECRSPFYKLSDFYAFDTPSFVFVRVLATQQWTDNHDEFISEKQTSTVQILSVLWSGVELADTMELIQFKIGGCCQDEATNLLREDAVYLLPIYQAYDDLWYVSGDMDVLFEVDDQGLIWSHSLHPAFNTYDGTEATEVATFIKKMTTDVNFPLATTDFGTVLRSWGVLVETTVKTIDTTYDEWGNELYCWEVTINNVLSLSQDPSYSWLPQQGLSLTIYSYDLTDFLDVDKRYLMMLDPSGSGPYVYPQRTALINDNNSITALSLIDQVSMFTEFDGYQTTKIARLAKEIIKWQNTYSR